MLRFKLELRWLILAHVSDRDAKLAGVRKMRFSRRTPSPKNVTCEMLTQ